MNRGYGFFLLMLPVAVAFSGAPALAQYYSSPPRYYRNTLPPVVYDDDRASPPAFWSDDDDDAPPARRPQRSPQMSQVPPPAAQPGAPGRILPYPDDTEQAPPLPPGFAPPAGRPEYGHQLDQQAPRSIGPGPAATRDPDEIRPPGSIGPGPGLSGHTPSPIGPEPGAAPPPPAGTAALPPEDQPEQGKPRELPPNLKKQLVTFNTKEPAGTIIIDTPNTYLYLVLGSGNAMRYGIGVGREGFTWAGTERISRMKEWPDWFPPPEMIDRQPYLPRQMAGGPGNPLGARALYLGNTLYRIHGTNQPSTIGSFVSSGCIRLLNEDIEDLYSRVQTGTRVVVLPGKAPEHLANTGTPTNAEPANPMAPPPRPGTTISGAPLPPAR
ncbi:MAG TPA: L,D-transpeptidase [Pseudolabrys sp.]|jgi:lipoprotein-anchoring transpeptidase ErfK/SrfK